MGWSAGSQLAIQVYNLVKTYIPEEERHDVAWHIKNMFEEHDADDWNGESELEQDAEE
jgi:hypothetical protein